MSKVKTQFVCQVCGAIHPKWVGRCSSCGEWNTLVEQVVETKGKGAIAKAKQTGKVLKPQAIKDVASTSQHGRILTGVKDLDAVLGGGVVQGGVTLLAGQPGIGKSTLLMQLAGYISQSKKVLYVSGEESAQQVKLRAERLGVLSGVKDLDFISTTSAGDVAATIHDGSYDLVIVDSIQTMALEDLTSAPGTVSQVTGASNVVIRAAKDTNTAVMLVGHVTKDGTIAGPKVLEHLVDVVLQFEGDRYGGFKVVRAAKNRYGSTAEAVIFEMDDSGLQIVENPSETLLKERNNLDGSVILATVEGNRPILVEIQALVNTTSFGYPKRAASGFDLNRLNLLVAVLEKRTNLKLADKDIYINVVGGVKLDDRAADLAICMAIASVASGRKLADDLVVFGEVGLGGEVRSAKQTDRRIQEAKKLGFKKAIAPSKGFSGNNKTFIDATTNLRSALIKHLQN